MTTREQFLSHKDYRTEPVELDGFRLHVRSMTGHHFAKLRQKLADAPEHDRDFVGLVWLVLFTACDEHGGLIFTEDDYPALSQKAPETLGTLAEAANRVNRFDTVAAKKS